MITIGTMDTLLVHPREVFRGAIVAGASKIVLMHNHPSGDPDPSEADIKVTRDIARGGQLLKIELLDHIIVGHEKYVSLRERGYLYT
jgi:DNA repair protein RadC